MVNDVCHIEWNVTNLDRSQKFYEGIFDWKFNSFMEGMVIFGNGEKHIGGLLLTSEVKAGSSPSIWIQVDSIDAISAKATGLGGKVLRPKSEVPTVGFSALLADPDGNEVGIVEYVC